jgi:glutaredoxin
MENLKGVYIIYGISDCPACLRACAAAMDLYPSYEYVFVNTDFSKSHRQKLKLRYGVETFPIIIFEENGCKTPVGGYDELTSFIANREEYIDNSTPIKDNKKEPT